MTDPSVDSWLDDLEASASAYFLHEADSETGLVLDKSGADAPASIAGSGFALTCYALAAERGYLSRKEAVERTRRALRFLFDAPQGDGKDAIGAHGFFYHFLDMRTGRRVWNSELSTIDSAILFAGVLAAAQYFDRDTAGEQEIRATADKLYRRADWQWVLNGGPMVSLGWHPDKGFLRNRWSGYSEALLLYVLGLGSPSQRLPVSTYANWCRNYRWKKLYGREFVYAGPLFIHQLSHCWIDFRDIRDAYMRKRGIDYFENSRRATYVQRDYATRNPRAFEKYGPDCWGISASDGPGPVRRTINGRARRFWEYHARGVPYGPDDGTLSPWALLASLPFAPEIVVPATRAVAARYPDLAREYGFAASFNPTFRGKASGKSGWISPSHYAINQGPVALMIENYRSDLVWRLMRGCPYIVSGLRRAGFRGGWLAASETATASVAPAGSGPRTRPYSAR
jgi:hypothetical protein